MEELAYKFWFEKDKSISIKTCVGSNCKNGHAYHEKYYGFGVVHTPNTEMRQIVKTINTIVRNIFRVNPIEGSTQFDFKWNEDSLVVLQNNNLINGEIINKFIDYVENLIFDFENNFKGLFSQGYVNTTDDGEIDFSWTLIRETHTYAENYAKHLRRLDVEKFSKTIYADRIKNINNIIRGILDKEKISYGLQGGRSGGGYWASEKTKYNLYIYIYGEDDYLSGCKFSRVIDAVKEQFGDSLGCEFYVYNAPNGISFSTELNHIASDFMLGVS